MLFVYLTLICFDQQNEIQHDDKVIFNIFLATSFLPTINFLQNMCGKIMYRRTNIVLFFIMFYFLQLDFDVFVQSYEVGRVCLRLNGVVAVELVLISKSSYDFRY